MSATKWLRPPALLLLFGLAALPAMTGATPGGWIEPNLGQSAADVAAIARTQQLTALLGPTRARIVLPGVPGTRTAGAGEEVIELRNFNTLDLEIVGADPAAKLELGTRRTGISRYFRGSDKTRWLDDVDHHESARFVAVYPGIDLVYRFRDSQLEYDFEVAPGADIAAIRLGLSGARDVSLDAAGNWIATTSAGVLTQRAPEVFRVAATGLESIAGEFLLEDEHIRFVVADAGAAPVVIDPVIEYSSYLGGSATDDAMALAVNALGNYVVAGNTESVDIPGPVPGDNSGGQDIFVAEIDRTTNALLWIDYIGGSGFDSVDNMAVDSQGNPVLIGYSESDDFPLMNAFQTTFVGAENPATAVFDSDGIVLKIAADGSALTFSTYYGGLDQNNQNGSSFEFLRGLAFDAQDNIYVAGQTGAADFPVTQNFQNRACMESDVNAMAFLVSDIVLMKFAPDGSRLFATCIGGTERDAGRDVALDAAGAVYVGGFARSGDLPTTAGAFQTATSPLDYSPFVLKLNAALDDVVFGTYAGGSDFEVVQEIAVTATGSVIIAGSTASTDFPFTPNAIQTTLNGFEDGFVLRLNPAGTALEFSTYFGGSQDEQFTALAVDSDGRAFVAGNTSSLDVQLRLPLFSVPDGADILLAAFDTVNATLDFSTYLDSGGADGIFRGLSLDGPNRVLIAGSADGGAWPAVAATQPMSGGLNDAILMVINLDEDADGVFDSNDNCLSVSNADQRDTDGDDYGSVCDPDFNNDGTVDFVDLGFIKQRFFGADPIADMNGDGIVDFLDLGIVKQFFFGSPGPSGLLL